ncbi:MAG: hypothetical protein K2O00_08685 [Muribaculaceae bacterium]|nr:hypothetical protein [Muribaculaceae bacterium]
MRGGIYIDENEITRFFHIRGGFFFVALLSVVATTVAYFSGDVKPMPADGGLIFGSPSQWITMPAISLIVSLLLNILLGYSIVLIIKQFNTIRSLSRLAATMFLVLQSATPAVTGQFYGGTFAAIIMVLETVLLLSVYERRQETKRIFLIFFLITSGALFCQPLMFYLPFLFFALAQMRVLTIRSVVAAIIGVITLLWILLGFGVITVDQLRLPEVITIFDGIPSLEPPMLFAILLTAVYGILFLIGNLMKLLSYNTVIRAYNSVFLLWMFSTIILMLIDVDSITVYLPVLNLAVAYQIAHFFAERRHKRSYLAIVATILPYIAIYLWNLL